MSMAVRTDEQIQQNVLKELRWDMRVWPSEVGVTVKDGVVTLTGSVDNYTRKWAATQAALRVGGCKAVANDLEVRLSSAATRTDTDIAAAAVRALEWDAVVPTENLNVSVSDGIVTLKGEVDYRYEREDAERVVRRLTGVCAVVNLITVRPLVSAPLPSEIKQDIEDALLRRAEFEADRITVETIGNKVVLRGTVRSWAERAEAEDVAWSEPGVMEIDDRITIAP
jgi:osmotically-inducible protein OsmY